MSERSTSELRPAPCWSKSRFQTAEERGYGICGYYSDSHLTSDSLFFFWFLGYPFILTILGRRLEPPRSGHVGPGIDRSWSTHGMRNSSMGPP